MAGFWERELAARRQAEQSRRVEEQRAAAEVERRRREERRRAADAARLAAQAEERERQAAVERARQAAMARREVVPPTQVVPEVRQAERRSFWDRLPTGTPMVRPIEEQPTVEEFAAQLRPAGQLVSDVLFGPEVESVRPGTQQAGLLERFARTQAGEQEFRTAVERAREGRSGAAVGWGLLGLAGAVPFFGDIAQGAAGVSRAVRGAEAAGDVARGAERAAEVVRSPLVREGAETIPGAWAERAARAGDSSEVPTEWLAQFREFDRRAIPGPGVGVDKLKQSIVEEGFKEPLILEVGLNGRATLIEGNHRLAAAMELGLENVPVRVITARNVRIAGTESGKLPSVSVPLRPDIGDGWYLKPDEAIFGVPPAVADTPNLNRIGVAERAADVGRAAESRWADAWRGSQAGQDWRAPDISEGVAQEILNESMQFTLPQERLASIPEQRRPTAEVFHRQQFDAEPQRIEGKFFYPAVDSSGGTPIYRGLSAASEDEAAQYAQQFLSGEYHIGVGFNGRGSYFGTDPRTALEYASMMSRDFPQGRPGAIVRAIVPPKARIFDDSLDSALTRSIMRSFSASNFDDLGMYLAALGYDGQRVKRLGEEYIVMYNRGILKADESVYKVSAGLKRQKDEGGWEGMSQILRNLYGEDFVR